MKIPLNPLWIIVSSVLLLSSCGGENKPAATAPGGAPTVKDYAVVEVSPQAFVVNSAYPATIEGEQNVEIRPKIDGYIESIYVDEGATVKRGQRLFHIRAPQYEQEVRTAEANISIAVADVNAAEMEVNKVRPLVEKGIVSKYVLQSANFALQARQAALAQARATLANAKTNIGYTTVTSPVNGVIGVLPYKIGSLVNSNTAQPLTTVSNIDRIYAYFSLNEKQALDLSLNIKGAHIPPVSLILANGEEFSEKGKVETASGLINTETGSIRVRATFSNPAQLIRSGSSGTIVMPRQIEKALLVPQRSTFELQGKKFVFLLDSAATVKSTEIKILENSGGQFFVAEAGLKPGDKIVVEGVASLREGQQIKPREVKADSIFRQQ
mgnify:CR=1 FL=1